MGSNTGQTALIVVGTVVGAYFGVPQLGMMLGSLAGQVAFPTDLGTVTGPRLNDANTQVSTIGAPISLVYGTYALSGNLIWSSGIIETVKRKRQGGKGGPTQTIKTFSYKVNCAVGICEGPVTGIRRIWADAKVIYDRRAQFEGESDFDYELRIYNSLALHDFATIYLGSEDQEPDPTIESFDGITRVSAFRGLAYVVFNDFQLEDYGNRIPNFRFEVDESAAVAAFTPYSVFSNTVLFPWIAGDDPRNPLNAHEYIVASHGTVSLETQYTGPTSWTNNIDLILQAYTQPRDTYIGFRLWGSQVIGQESIYQFNNRMNGEAATWDVSDLPLNFLDTFLDYVSYDGPIGYQTTVQMTACDDAPAVLGDTKLVPSNAEYTFNTGFLKLLKRISNASSADGVDFTNTIFCGAFNVAWSGVLNVKARRIEQPPLALSENPEWQAYGEDQYVEISTGNIVRGFEWAYDTSTTYKVLQKYSTYTSGSPLRLRVKYPLNPCLPIGHADYSSQAFWESAYNAAVADDKMDAGLVYGVHYPVTQAWAYIGTGEISEVGSTTSCTQLGAIVSHLCERAGLQSGQIDVSDLTECVHGYAVSRVMSARDAISPLRSFGWFDCVESDGVLKWPTRGKAPVATLTSDDLAAHASGEQRPSAIDTTRTQEVELPRRLRVHYAQMDMNYEPGEQSASRLTAGDVEVRDMEVAVAMSHQKAAQIADVVLYDLWVNRNRYRLSVDHSWLHLEPADAILAPVDGRQERLRITSIDHSLPGLLRLESVRDDDGVYVSYAIGNDPDYAGIGHSVASIGVADLVLLDLPALRDEDDDPGYYAAVQAVGGSTFGGAAIFRSPDGGTTYDEVAVITTEATIGELTESLATGPTTIIDEGNILTVECEEDLESISHESLLAGRNAAAIGDDGRWEIVQFRDAEQLGSPPVWQLTGLLRGRRGTEWAIGTSEVGDRFVLLDTAIERVPLNLAAVGASRPHKAVLAGASIDGTTAVDFTGRGVALEPFAVVHVEGERDGNDLTITWIRRGRIGQELPANIDIPLSEASESYEVDVLDGVTVIRTISAASPTATYTSAQQITDFGSPQSAVAVRIYQLSATVGRGYPTEATL